MNTILAGAPVFSSSTKTAYVLARDAEYLSGAVFWGGLTFVSALWPAGTSVRRVRLLLTTAWTVGAFATLAALALEGAWIAQRGPSGALRADVLSAVLQTDFGREWSAKTLLWLLALVLLVQVLGAGSRLVTGPPFRLGLLAVGLASLRIDGLTGHSADTRGPAIAELADLTHLVAITVWLGGLTMLVVGVLPRRDVGELERIVPQYSLVAMCAVAAVVFSGSVLAWRLLDNVGQLPSTTWGHLLLLKVALLAVVLVAAFGSKTWVAHRLEFAVILRGERALVRPFVLSVAVETALAVSVLAVAGFLATADLGR
jgi:copper transport protein